jgi:hypothetical protein
MSAFKLKPNTVLALVIFTEVGQASPLDSWTWRNPLPTGNDPFRDYLREWSICSGRTEWHHSVHVVRLRESCELLP